MLNETGTAPTRWAGVPQADRVTERRALLVAAGFDLFSTEGERAVTVRAVCRSCELHTRYFYESFPGTDELIGAVYDTVASELDAHVQEFTDSRGGDLPARIRAGIAAVLHFSSVDPRRGRVLFTEARTHPVLILRREASQGALMDAVLDLGAQLRPEAAPGLVTVGAAMFTGAMVELVQQWLSGRLGDDLDAVIDHTVTHLLPSLQPETAE
ncbi:TetR/AcrR family transcriptional regulator [Streptomyces sp. NPDC051546]|uniref:TetR/AcrR family transcriptional regulator n=1 Tax=Streptomyces sp. NPDC051546 TaxID=3365655 RepID=UPI0037A4A759